jgi:hypothetical protein
LRACDKVAEHTMAAVRKSEGRSAAVAVRRQSVLWGLGKAGSKPTGRGRFPSGAKSKQAVTSRPGSLFLSIPTPRRGSQRVLLNANTSAKCWIATSKQEEVVTGASATVSNERGHGS